MGTPSDIMSKIIKILFLLKISIENKHDNLSRKNTLTKSEIPFKCGLFIFIIPKKIIKM